MEIVFTGEFPPLKGGVGNYIHSRCQSPPSKGLRVLAAESSGCRDWDATSGLDVVRFPYRHGTALTRRLEQAWRARRALIGELKRDRVQLVTANVLFPFGWIAASYKSAGYRVALFCHGAELLRAQLSRIGRLVYAKTRRNVDLFVANSRMTYDTLVEQGCDPGRICIIPPPIDSSRFHPGVDGAELRRKWTSGGAAGPILLSVCRLDDIGKGIDTMFDVVAGLRLRFPNVRYVVVGDGPTRKHYEMLAERRGVQSQVIFTGRVSDDDLPRCHAACDLFVLLSRRIPEIGYYEGFGIVYREAMACGKPVVISREAGFRDYAVNGEDGVIVDPRNIEEITRACVEILDNPGRAAEMGAKAARSATRPTDWSKLNDFVR